MLLRSSKTQKAAAAVGASDVKGKAISFESSQKGQAEGADT